MSRAGSAVADGARGAGKMIGKGAEASKDFIKKNGLDFSFNYFKLVHVFLYNIF